MTRRPRKHIPMVELLASALADKLPYDQRQFLRAQRVKAREVVRMFTPDHVHLHAWGGPDKWHNITMTRRGVELKVKDAADTGRAAKAVRIDSKWERFMRAVAAGKKPPPRKRTWPKRKMGRRA